MKRIMAVIFLAVFSLAISAAAEEGPGPEGSADYNAVYGKVLEVDADAGAITLETYDYDKDEEITVTYHIEKGVTIDGAATLGEIKPGDWVEIDFHKGEGEKRVIDFMAVEREPILEEELLTEEEILKEGIDE